MAKGGKSRGGARTHVQFRNAGSGRFVTAGRAKNMKPENVVRERVPNPGYGDTGPKKNK